jgi:thiosulfate/3-mercaptopyruvate sulfurtransferase
VTLKGSSNWPPSQCRFSSLNRTQGYLRALKATVTPSWLKKHLASKNVVVLDARSRNAYSRAHIPGARNADLFHYFVPGTDTKNLKVFQNDLELKLGRLGLRGGENALVYESGFGMRAARVAWMLEYAGIKAPLMLEGGFRAWQDSKYPIEKKRREVVPTKFKANPDPRVLATFGQVRSLSRSRTGLVLDVRTREEYDGSEKRECCPRSGRIPGSTWFEWTNFLDGRGGFQSLGSVSRQLRSMGVHPDTEIAVYCHRGARAAAAFYALRSMGYNKARNYVGSWHEWSSKKNLPSESSPQRP